MQNPAIVGQDDLRAGDLIYVRSRWRSNHDFIAWFDEAESAKRCIAMRRDARVSMMPWKSRMRYVPRAKLQCVVLRSLEQRNCQAETRRLDNSQQLSAMDNISRRMQSALRHGVKHCTVRIDGLWRGRGRRAKVQKHTETRDKYESEQDCASQHARGGPSGRPQIARMAVLTCG